MNMTDELFEEMGFEFIPTELDSSDFRDNAFAGRWYYTYASSQPLNIYTNKEATEPTIRVEVVIGWLRLRIMEYGERKAKEDLRKWLGVR